MGSGNAWDLVVVGGGVVGLGVARDARRRGLRVLLLDRGRAGGEATWAAAGMLSPLSEAHADDGPFLEVGLASLRAFRDWVGEVEEEAGFEVEYRECGKLMLALSTPERSRLQAHATRARDAGLGARWLEPRELRREEPGLALSVQGALHLEEDYRVDPRRLAEALLEAVRRAGVEVREGTEVRGIDAGAGGLRGVLARDGTAIPAERVVVAAGAWSGGLEGLPCPLPVRPVRGQMAALRPSPPLPEVMLESEEVYLIPRDDGRLLIGATVEEVGFRPGLTADGVRGLLEAAGRIVPGLGRAALVELWSGFRPGSPDGQPILGEHPELPGLFLATGHFRNGILLAPYTARALGAALAGEPEPAIPDAFRAGRFRETP
jgi:glycine oxidase